MNWKARLVIRDNQLDSPNCKVPYFPYKVLLLQDKNSLKCGKTLIKTSHNLVSTSIGF